MVGNREGEEEIAMNVSPAKLEANRRNAREHATGPKTKRGKGVVRFNALKHGLLAREVVMRNPLYEDGAEFDRLLKGLHQQYRPVGSLEELLVQELALGYWRKCRAVRAERGILEVELGELGSRVFPEDGDGSQSAKTEYLLDLITASQQELANGGSVSENLLKVLNLLGIPVPTTPVEKASEPEGDVEVKSKSERQTGSASDPESEAETEAETELAGDAGETYDVPKILSLLDDEKLRQEAIFDAMAEVSEQRAEARLAASSIPVGDSLDRLLRYEARMTRDIQSAMNRLERIQAIRRGEQVQPPISVEVSGTKEGA
jgi:hypothetical protein